MKCVTTLLVTCSVLVQSASATLLQYEFSAKVTIDAGSPLVEPDDVIFGTFAYDANPTTAVRFPTDPIPFTWDRPAPPIGITLNANGSILSQNASNFAQLWVINDVPGLEDQFEFVSFIGPRTEEDPFLYSGGIIDLVLQDLTGSAFDSSDLPTTLTFDAFTSGELTVYDGVNPYFAANIITVTPIPEPASALLLLIAIVCPWFRGGLVSGSRFVE